MFKAVLPVTNVKRGKWERSTVFWAPPVSTGTLTVREMMRFCNQLEAEGIPLDTKVDIIGSSLRVLHKEVRENLDVGD